MIEFAKLNDRDELTALWQETFDEDKAVCQSFFENIFASTVTPVIRENGEIVSSMFLIPCKIGEYNGKYVYCAMTKKEFRGKGYMKELLNYSYNCDFLCLVPAEASLFEYYKKCGFEKFGIGRKAVLNGKAPTERKKLSFDFELQFDTSVSEYWKNACVHYGGTVSDFGLCFDDKVIRNASGDYENIPDSCKKSGIVQGNITFGEDYTPAMIKTDKEIKNLRCYIGVTLE